MVSSARLNVKILVLMLRGDVALRPLTSLPLAGLGERCRAIQKRALAKIGRVVWFSRVYGLPFKAPAGHWTWTIRMSRRLCSEGWRCGALKLVVIQW